MSIWRIWLQKIDNYIKHVPYYEWLMRKQKFMLFLRVLLVLLPQIGYIHPDEFFQSTEIMIGDVFDVEHKRTWEFDSRNPIRSVAILFFVMRMPLILLRVGADYIKLYFGINIITSYVLLVWPRLVMCALSFVNDWCLNRICRIYDFGNEVRLWIMSTSYVMLVYGTRTLSNTIEMTLCSLLIYYASDSMLRTRYVIHRKEFLQEKYIKAKTTTEKVKCYKLINALPPHTMNGVFIMSTLCVIGVFNRPTFFIFGAPMVFHWLRRGLGKKAVSFTDFNARFVLFCICSIPSMCLFTVIDSVYYNYLTSGEIQMGNFGINNFVFTPWNFIKYNIDPAKTAQHGVHPWWFHVLVSMPLLYGVLGILAIGSFLRLATNFLMGEFMYLPKTQTAVNLMSSAIFGPLFIMSLINHKEPRFLIPFMLPITVVHAMKIYTIATPHPTWTSFPLQKFFYNLLVPEHITGDMGIRNLWYITNIILVIFYGFLHQAGVYTLAAHFGNVMRTKPTSDHIHLVTSHIYSMPLAFLNIPSTTNILVDPKTRHKYRRKQEFFIYELGSGDLERNYYRMMEILEQCHRNYVENRQRYQLYLALPSSLRDDLNKVYYFSNGTVPWISRVTVLYPHISTEALPNFFRRYTCRFNTDSSKDVLETCYYYDQDYYWSIGNIATQISSFVNQFGLAIYRFNLMRPNE